MENLSFCYNFKYRSRIQRGLTWVTSPHLKSLRRTVLLLAVKLFFVISIFKLKVSHVLSRQIYYLVPKLAQKYVSPLTGLCSLNFISSYYTTPLSNRVGSVCKYLSPFAFVSQRQMRGRGRAID